MPQLIQHRLKSSIMGSGEASFQNRGNTVKRITDEQLAYPVWIAIPDVNVSQGLPWTIDLDDYCKSIEAIAFSINSGALPTGITLNADGTFSGTVTDASGSGSVTFTATTTNATSNSGTLGWTIP